MKKVMSMIRAVAVLGMGFAVVAPSQADCVGWTSRSTLAFTPEPAGQVWIDATVKKVFFAGRGTTTGYYI